MITYTCLKLGRRPTGAAVGFGFVVAIGFVVGFGFVARFGLVVGPALRLGLELGVELAPEPIVGVGLGNPTAVAVGVPAVPEAFGLALGVAEPQAARAIVAAMARASETHQPCPHVICVRRIRIDGNDTLTIRAWCDDIRAASAVRQAVTGTTNPAHKL
jgi:hypothetical protein